MSMLKRMSMAMAAGNQSNGSLLDSESTITESTMMSKVTNATRPSLAGVMFARKFSKRMSSRVVDRRLLGTIGGSSSAGIQGPQKEPTYRMEPAKIFSSCEAKKILVEVADDRLENYQYNPKTTSGLIKTLSEDIKERIKYLGYDRYKIVCYVSLCQANGQSAVSCSRAMMDKDNDTYATYTVKTNQFICNITVFGIYRE